MFSLFKQFSPFARRTTATLALAAAFIGCTQTPAPDASIEITDETGAVATTQAVPVNGLKGDYFDNIDFTGTTKVRYDATINSNWKAAAPIAGIAATTYSVRWTGQIQPAFTEEYTFSLTSSGQARLMINGVVLVNNWTEHASKVDTGKVSLQANTKYDIRLEYARNATQPALVKLEWQSKSRAKQVVPNAALFSSGSNVADGLQIMASTLTNRGVTIDTQSAHAYLGTDLLVTAASPGAFVQARIALPAKKLFSLIRFKYVDATLELENLLTRRAVKIPNFIGFFDAQQKLIPEKIDLLTEYLAEVYLPDDLETYVFSDPAILGGTLAGAGARPQNNWVFPCADCTDARRNVLRQARLTVIGGGLTIFVHTFPTSTTPSVTTGIVSGIAKVGADWGQRNYVPSPMPTQDEQDNYINPAVKTFRDCIALKCPPQLIKERAEPSSIKAKRNESFEFVVKFENSATAGDYLVYDSTLQVDYTPIKFEMLSGQSGKLKPGWFATIRLRGQCPNIDAPSNGTATITIQSNDPARPSLEVKFFAECGNSPKIIATPNPLELNAEKGYSGYAPPKSDSGVIALKNEGLSDLTVKSVFLEYSARDGESFSMAGAPSLGSSTKLAPSAELSVTITGTCGNSFGVYNAKLLVESDDLSTPMLEVGISLRCISTPGTTIVSVEEERAEWGGGSGIDDPDGHCSGKSNVFLRIQLPRSAVIGEADNATGTIETRTQIDTFQVSRDDTTSCYPYFVQYWSAKKTSSLENGFSEIRSKLKPYFIIDRTISPVTDGFTVYGLYHLQIASIKIKP
jgi:hypothetical protein